MLRTFTWLTMFMLIAESAQAEEPKDLSGAIYSIGRDMARMQQQIEDLRNMVAKLSQKDVCREPGHAAKEDPPPPASTYKVAPSLPEKPLPATRGSVSGRVSFEGIDSKVAYVYVADLSEAPVKNKSVEIRQKGMRFRPDHRVVQSGTRISFPNDDKIHHHVFSVTPPNAFDLGYSRSDDPTPSQMFVAPGLVDINCNIHPQMNATVLVVPNRHHVPVKQDGTFTLLGVPFGKRTLRAWAPGSELAELQITVSEQTEAVALELTPRKRGSR